MTDETVLANASLVLPDEVVAGSLRIVDGEIVEIERGRAVPQGAHDCGGDFVAPGLIELHTDNLERHLVPRPDVDWPRSAAIVAHDAELAGAGITTVFDALRAGSITSRRSRKSHRRYARRTADEILAARDSGALKISHHLHLRAEICSETLLEELDEFGPEDRVGIVSLMDHTPGQRQFSDLRKFETYLRGRHGWDGAEFSEYVSYLRELREELGTRHETAAVAAASRFGAVLASHDDTTTEQVETSRGHGVTIAEFPTTIEAATASRNADIEVIGGAPNLVQGGSHSGNVAVKALAEKGVLDILSSDYVPASLLLGATLLGDLWGDMARGIATVTSAAARATNLPDRGVLKTGTRADVLRFSRVGGIPAVRGVWSQGRRVA